MWFVLILEVFFYCSVIDVGFGILFFKLVGFDGKLVRNFWERGFLLVRGGGYEREVFVFYWIFLGCDKR